MLHDALQAACIDKFKNAVASLGTFGGNPVTVEVWFDNAKKTFPGNLERPPSGAPWIRFTVRPGEAAQKTFGAPGNNRHRKVGICIAQIFTPSGSGSGLADYIARKIEVAFTSVTVSGVRFRTPTPGEGRRVGEEWQLNVTIPFIADRFA